MADLQTDDPLVGHFGGATDTSVAASSTDDPLVGSFGTGESGGYTPYTHAPDWHAADIGHGLAAGFHGGVGAPLAEVTGQTEEAEAERQSATASRGAMTPGAEQTWPVYIAEQAAPTAAMVAPALIPGVGLPLSAAAGAAISGGSAISENKEAIQNTNDIDLMDKNPTYRDYRQSGMTEEQAKTKLGQDTALNVGVPSALIGGALGAAGGVELTGIAKLGVGPAEDAALGGSNFLTRRVTGRGANAVVGAGRGAAEMGPLGAVQTAVTGHEQAKEGIGEEATPDELLTAGVGQGLFGAGVGLAGGAFHGKTRLPEGGVSAEPTRSDRNYRKPVDMTQKSGVSGSTTGGYSLDPDAPGTKTATATPVVDTSPPPPTAENKGVGPAETSALNPEPVTPRVSEPPTPSVEQPPVVQPTPPPSETGREAPPAGDTTGEPSPPQPPTEVGPTPVPAPPREDVGAVVPETPETLAAQHAALLDPGNSREAMVYPKGSQPIDIVDKKAFGQVKLPDGRIVQFDKNGPSGLSVAKIRDYAKTDRLNEALQLGPVSKDEALSRVAEGETPVAVTERTPAGAEAKAAAGTETTAPAQVADLEASKTPGNVVSVERPEDVVAARQAEIAQPRQVVQPEVANPLGKAAPPTGRILEAQDEASVRARNEAAFQEAQAARSVQDQLRAKEAAKQAAAAQEAGVKGRVHTAKVDQAKVANDNIGAQRIVDKYPRQEPTPNWRNDEYSRAKAMVNEAKAAGIKIPDTFPEGHPHNDAMLKLREAADLTATKYPKPEAYARFLDREHLIDTGRGQEAFAVRRNEGALGTGSVGLEGGAEGVRAKGGAVDEEGKPQEAPEEARAEAAYEETPTEHAAAGGEEEHVSLAGPTDAERQAQRMAERRAESEAMREAARTEDKAPKAAVGFQTAVKKSRAIKRQELEDEPHHVMVTNSEGNPVGVEAQRSTTLSDALDEHYDNKNYSPEMRPMMDRLTDAIDRRAGDKSTYYVSHDDMLKTGERVRGLYDPNENHILLNADKMTHDTVLHEGFHAATSEGLKDSELKSLMGRLQDEMGVKGDAEEFLTRLMTDNKLQDQFKGEKVSPELARDIGIPKWRKATMWEAALNIIRRALGLGPRDVGAVEAAMALSEKAMWKKDPGMAMEAGARSLGLKFQKMEPEEAIHERANDAQEAAVKPSSFWNSDAAQAVRTNSEQKWFNAKAKASATDALRIDNEHMFGDKTEANPMRRAQEGLLKQEKMIQNALQAHDPLMQRMMNMKRTNPDGLDRLVTLLSESANFNVHPDEALGAGRNDHIKPDRKGKFGVNANAENHEGILAHPRLSDDFNRSTEEERSLFSDLRDALMEEGHKSVKAGIETFSNGLRENFDNNESLQEALRTTEANRTPSEIKQVERYNAVTKVLDGDKLEGDEADKFNEDPHIKMLRDLRGMLKQEGPYFPGSRKGDYVVNAEHELPKAPKAVSVKDKEVTFANKQDAYDYRQELVDKSLPSRMEKVTEPTSTEQKPGQGEQYKVTVQTKASYGVNDVYEGRKLGDALRQMGLDPTEPMLREKNASLDYGLHSGTLRAQEHAIDALTHLSNDQKAALKEANEQASLGLMKGNRINSGLLKSNRVGGANADPVLAVHDYLANSARSQARSKTMPDIDKAFGEMRDITRKVQDANTPKRGVLVREMEDRALHFGKEGFTGQMSPFLQRITALAYVKDMMAPIHYALDLTHPYLYSIPQLAGRHGFAQSHAAYLKTLSNMGAGKTLGRGVKGMLGALKSDAHVPTDLLSSIRDSLVKNGATTDQLKAFDSGRETPHLGSIITDYRKSFDRTGMVDRATQYLQNIGNEMSHAVDSTNRVATYMSAYDLERAKMGKPQTLAQSVAHHAQAVRYAKDTVSPTLGIYSASNRASFLKNPVVRAAMQFRAVPMMIYRLLAKNVYNAIRGETPEIQRAAIISLVSTMGTTAALAGVASGVPEPIRLAVEMSHALGLTRSWDEYEDAARRATTNSMGKFGGHLVMDGILGAAGLSASSRIGLNDLMVKNQALQSPKDFLFDMVGSGTGYVKDEWDGVNSILKGDYKHGIPSVIPIRLFSDIAKAYAENESGKPGQHGQPDMTPLDPYETFIKAAGGTPTREALYNKETGLIKEDSAERKQAIAAAGQGDRAAANRWNLAHPQNRITAGHILKARQAGRASKPMTPRQRANAEEYNVYQ